MTALLSLFNANWRLVGLLALCSACLALGWHWRGVSYDADQADQLRQLVNARRRQEDDARTRDTGNEVAAAAVTTTVSDRTREAHQNATLPDRLSLFPAASLRDIDAAATAP